MTEIIIDNREREILETGPRDTVVDRERETDRIVTTNPAQTEDVRVVSEIIEVATPGPQGPQGPPGDGDGGGGPGAPGQDGRTVLSGSGAPAGGLGTIGDFYISTSTWLIYGPKTVGGWGIGSSLIGPVGADSTVPGPPGDKGDTGPAGPSGRTVKGVTTAGLETTINHGWGTRDVRVEVFSQSAPYQTDLVHLERPTLNQAKLVFQVAVTAGQYRYLLQEVL